MKKTGMVSIIIFLIIAFWISNAIGVTTLTYSDHDPPNGLRVDSVKIWIDLIEKESNGRLKVKPIFGGALGSASEALKLVGSGSVDMAFVFPDFYPKQLLCMNIFKLFPEGPGKWENIYYVYDQVFKTVPEFSTELEKENQKLIYVTASLPAALCATYPVKSIDDLKGKKWRASSRWHLMYLKALGATPVSVPWVDCYMSLQTGVINGVLTDYDGMHDTKLDEVAPNIYINPKVWFGTPFMHTININTWKKLSKEDQDAITRASQKVSKEIFGPMFVKEYSVIMADQKKAGAKIVIWKEEDLNKWKNNPGVKVAKEIWIKEAKEAGIKEPEKVMEAVGKIIREASLKEKN